MTVTGITNIKVTGACNISATTVNIDGTGPAGAGSKTGTVTQQCICALTGLPHPDASTNVKESY